MRTFVLAVVLTATVPAFAQSGRALNQGTGSAADAVTWPASPADTSNPANLGAEEDEFKARTKSRDVPPAAPPLPRYYEREYPPPNEPAESPRK